jgi:hypothetical protein
MQLAVQDYAAIIASLKEGAQAGGHHEKRRATRMELQSKVVVAPVNNGVIGTAFCDLTRDISLTGMGLLQSVAMNRDQHLVVRLPRGAKKALFVLCVVMHCRALADGLFGVGIEFVELMSAVDEEKVLPRTNVSELDRIRGSILN